jgi:hypothetical protein
MTILPARNDYPNLGGYAKASYSFAVDGGAVGAIPLKMDLPQGAIILPSSLIDITSALTGASATIAFSLIRGSDVQIIRAAGAVAGFGAGILALTADPVKVARDSKLNLVVAAAPLTAGILTVYLDYRI